MVFGAACTGMASRAAQTGKITDSYMPPKGITLDIHNVVNRYFKDTEAPDSQTKSRSKRVIATPRPTDSFLQSCPQWTPNIISLFELVLFLEEDIAVGALFSYCLDRRSASSRRTET